MSAIIAKVAITRTNSIPEKPHYDANDCTEHLGLPLLPKVA